MMKKYLNNKTNSKAVKIRYGNKIYNNLGHVLQHIHDDILTADDVTMEDLHNAQIGFEPLNKGNKKSDSWDAGEIYSGKLTQELYVFQKAFGMTVVYYNMFNDFLTILNRKYPDVRLKLNVLSIGCGSKIDALGLKYSNQDFEDIIQDVHYIGIDPGEWYNSDCVFYLNDDDEYVTIPKPSRAVADIGRYYIDWECDYLRSAEFRRKLEDFNETEEDVYPINMVVFPNMLSEIIDIGLLNQLLDTIVEVYSKHEMYLLMNRNVMVPDYKNPKVGIRKDESQNDAIENYDTDGWLFWAYSSRLTRRPGTKFQLGVRLESDVPIYRNDEKDELNDICRRYMAKTGDVMAILEFIKKISEFNKEHEKDEKYIKSPIVSRRFMQHEIYGCINEDMMDVIWRPAV